MFVNLLESSLHPACAAQARKNKSDKFTELSCYPHRFPHDPRATKNNSMSEDQNTPLENDSTPVAVISKVSKKPTETLPSDRTTSEKMVDSIRAFVAASESVGGPVNNKQAGEVIGMSENTIVVTNAFFCDVGILNRVASGKFEVSQAARDYAQALEWKNEDAGEKLKPLFAEKWFSKTLLPRLRFKEMSMDAAISALAQASGSPISYKADIERVQVTDHVAFQESRLGTSMQ